MRISSGYLALCTLPNVQKTTSATLEESAKYSTIATTPPKKIDIATPAKITPVLLSLPSLVIQTMIMLGIKAKINAIAAMHNDDPPINPPNAIIAIQAPQLAPWEMPIVDGLANTFPKQLCSIHPHMPRPAPAKILQIMCGKRKFIKTI